MLPIGIGMIRFKDTCAEAKEFLTERNLKRNLVIACDKLLKVNTEVGPAKVKGDRSKSVLFDACILAKSLQEKGKEKKWKIIREVWVEMLAYAATHCRGNHPTCSMYATTTMHNLLNNKPFCLPFNYCNSRCVAT